MNVLCFVLALLIISFVQAQIIELTVDKTIANPGETIIFTIKENHQGQVMERREFTFDGHKVPWSSAVTPETPELTHKEKIPWIAHNDDKSLKDGA